MGNTNPTIKDSYQRVQWMWNASKNPFSNPELVNWCPYSDIENMIIEEAYIAKVKHVQLDDYYIDIANNRQISTHDVNKQRPVIRIVCDKNHTRLRSERFVSNLIAFDRSDGDLYGFIPLFIKEVVKHLNLTREQLPSKNETIVPSIVEKAALGIFEEGKILRKQREAEEIAKFLMKKQNEGIEEVWKCCARLYSLNSFLYTTLNQIMQLLGSKDQEEVWRSKIGTLGPFCLLLWDNPFDRKMTNPGTILYRGAQLSDDSIQTLKTNCWKEPKLLHSFQSFISCTRIRNIIENFNNVNTLIIMELQVAFTVDLSKLSEYPREEEVLLFPGVSFSINKVEFDQEKNKHLIYLILQQRHTSKSIYWVLLIDKIKLQFTLPRRS